MWVINCMQTVYINTKGPYNKGLLYLYKRLQFSEFNFPVHFSL